MVKSNVLQVDSFHLQYRIEGEGAPALVIGSALYYSRTFSQELRKNLQLIFMDHRGFGSSLSPIKTPCELDIILDDMETLRKTLSIERIIVIGHSGHGYMALEYAKKYPQHVSHVVLIGMGPNQSNESHLAALQYFNDSVCPERKLFLEKNLKLLEAELEQKPEERFINFCLRLGARSWYDFRFDASPLWKGVKVNMSIMDYLWGEVFREMDITKGLEHFNIPVFLALGHYDFLVAPFFSWYPIRDRFNDLTIRLFEQSGHTPQYEESELFNQEFLNWMETKDDN